MECSPVVEHLSSTHKALYLVLINVCVCACTHTMHRYKVSIKHCESAKSVEIIAGTGGTFLMTIFLKIKL